MHCCTKHLCAPAGWVFLHQQKYLEAVMSAGGRQPSSRWGIMQRNSALYSDQALAADGSGNWQPVTW